MSVLDHSATGAIATLTLTRPESMNALGQAGDGEAFAAACDAINADSTIRCAILTGAGRAFSAGGDVKAMQNRTGNFAGSPVTIADGYRDNIHRILRALHGLRVPLIAAINGPAIGLGCDLACLADMRIASSSSHVNLAHDCWRAMPARRLPHQQLERVAPQAARCGSAAAARA